MPSQDRWRRASEVRKVQGTHTPLRSLSLSLSLLPPLQGSRHGEPPRTSTLPDADANRDPITGAPGAHPMGTGVGAIGGAVAGAAAGSIAGPIGTVVGLVGGAIIDGLAGKGVAALNDLLENCRDGEYGFRACAEEVQSVPAKQLFNRRAAGCRAAEAELLPLIAAYGGKPAEGGTTGGALHRGWVHVKGSLGADSELTILDSCERGENTAIARYRKALKRALPSDVREVVERQAAGAQRNHDEVRDLRNAARAQKG